MNFNSLFDLLCVLLGFSLIIVLHELGHFLAARWAGIRVLAFALGFGPAIVSYRKGIGVRLGSTEPEYLRRLKAEREAMQRHDPKALSPTEYRWNVFPLGGYVKMLGQDDADPSARSDAPDSYSNAKPWKRLIVISAGVVMNVITAAVLFLVVFGVGLLAEAPQIGRVAPDSPAAAAIADNAQELGITEPGLQPGDRVLSIDGDAIAKFQDIATAAIMSEKGKALKIDVSRPGIDQVLHFRVTPRVDRTTGVLALGVAPASSRTLDGDKTEETRKAFADLAARLGLDGLKPGSQLVHVEGLGDDPMPYELDRLVRTGTGAPVVAEFRAPDGSTQRVTIRPVPALQRQEFAAREGVPAMEISHLLGLTPVMRVASVQPHAHAAGLRDGDVFARLGDVEWPTRAAGMEEIPRDGRKAIPVVVARRVNDQWTLVDLGEVPVREGKIGFLPDEGIETPFVAAWPARRAMADSDGKPSTPPSGAALRLAGGTQLVAIDGRPVESIAGLLAALRALAASGEGRTVKLTVKRPLLVSDAAETLTWTISAPEMQAIAKLGWSSPLSPDLFLPNKVLLKARSPGEAISMGLSETRKAMVQTYLTLARVFQGSVKVEHLKGPVGIAHVGTLLAERGWMWLFFFMAAVSVNLAVINFLPLPIVDGGHALFIIWEMVTGKPVSVVVQNVATLAGLLLIGSLFLFVTYHDVVNLWK